MASIGTLPRESLHAGWREFRLTKSRHNSSQHTLLDLELEHLALQAKLAELREEATPELLAELAGASPLEINSPRAFTLTACPCSG